MIRKSCTIVVCAVTGLTILINLILFGSMRHQLAFYGIDFIYALQQNPSEAGQVIFNIIQQPGKGYSLGVILGIVYLMAYRKLNALVYLIFMLFCIFLIAFSKQTFQDPRPFWIFDFIKELQWGCSSQYGFPSGHALISVLIFEPILSDFIGGSSKWKYIILIFTGTLIPFSRLYLGVHSVDQILLGLFLSVSLLTLYRYYLQQKIFKYLINCIKSKTTVILPLTFIFNAIFLLAPIILFIVNTKFRVIDSQILQSINTICKSDHTSYQIQKKISIQQIMIFGAFGLIYGVMLATKFGDQGQWIKYYLGEWEYGSVKNCIAKLGLYVLLCGAPGAIFVFLIPYFIENFYGAYFVSVLGMLFGGISLIFVVPLLCFSNNIIKTIECTQIRTISELNPIQERDSDKIDI